VSILPYDDRVERVEGFRFGIDDPGHPIVAGYDWEGASFTMCGYNKVLLKPDAQLVASIDGDPIIATGTFGKGRTAVFATDFAPHWGGDFIHWPGYPAFWAGLLRWLGGEG
ncbi:MAG: glutamine amidotransferase, partial [Thermomicrobiales bacterium]